MHEQQIELQAEKIFYPEEGLDLHKPLKAKFTHKQALSLQTNRNQWKIKEASQQN